MTNIEIVANFEREINKLDDAVNKPATDDSLYWLNQAIAKFCKTRFNGNAPHLTSYDITDMNNANRTVASVFECTADSFMYRVTNSLTDFHYRHHRARPLRIRTNDGCKLLTDKNYKIAEYHIGYLRYPETLTLDQPQIEYSDFSDDTMYEIIKMAAQMYIENQSDKRYQTLTNEVNTQE